MTDIKPLSLSALMLLATLAGAQAKPKVPAENQMEGYVMVYHKDADHGLHMAYSWDGYTWTALNDDLPIMAGDTIAVQKGIRDQVMLHFTTRFFRGRNHIRYVYMNDDFTAMASAPAFLFGAPKGANGMPSTNMIDSDITKIGDTYHLFTTENGHPRHSTSHSLTGPYVTDYSFDDGVAQAHEAPMLWKLIGQQKWILMQDRYSMEPHNFYFVETTDLTTFTPLGYFDDGSGPMRRTNFSEQKHGAVVQVTKEELQRLIGHWAKPAWQDPQVNAVNRLEAHADFVNRGEERLSLFFGACASCMS